MQRSREQQAQINLKFISVYLPGTVKCNFAKPGFPQQQTIKNLLFHEHCTQVIMHCACFTPWMWKLNRLHTKQTNYHVCIFFFCSL